MYILVTHDEERFIIKGLCFPSQKKNSSCYKLRVDDWPFVNQQCPEAEHVSKAEWLKEENGGLVLRKKYDYFFQVLAQLAVTGLPWCDFFLPGATKTIHHTVRLLYLMIIKVNGRRQRIKLTSFYSHIFCV